MEFQLNTVDTARELLVQYAPAGANALARAFGQIASAEANLLMRILVSGSETTDNEPVAAKPGKPATGKPATGKPATGKPATGKPTTAGKPTGGKPTTAGKPAVV